MIYTVELNFTDPSREAEWHSWYESYLRQLVTLPGLSTAQRFRAVVRDTQPWEYLAVYSLLSLDVYATDAYRAIGGGGNASKAFHHAITRRRNVYRGIERMPEVSEEARVLLTDDADAHLDLPDILFTPLEAASGRRQAGATQLDGTPTKRSIAVADDATVERLGLTARPGLAVYSPITRRHLEPAS